MQSAILSLNTPLSNTSTPPPLAGTIIPRWFLVLTLPTFAATRFLSL